MQSPLGSSLERELSASSVYFRRVKTGCPWQQPGNRLIRLYPVRSFLRALRFFVVGNNALWLNLNDDAYIGKSATTSGFPQKATAAGAVRWPSYCHAPLVISSVASLGQAIVDDIINHARRNLAGFKCPKDVVFRALPKTATGKERCQSRLSWIRSFDEL